MPSVYHSYNFFTEFTQWYFILNSFFCGKKNAVVVQLLAGHRGELFEEVFDREGGAFGSLGIENDVAGIHHDGAVAELEGLVHVVGNHETGDVAFCDD